jgi:hypothetical protein
MANAMASVGPTLIKCHEPTVMAIARSVPSLLQVLYLKRQLTDYHVEHVEKSRTLHVFVPHLGIHRVPQGATRCEC